MKNTFRIFIALITAVTFVSCDYDDDAEPLNYVTFERGPQSVPVDVGGSESREITVYTGNVTGADRTFNINTAGTLSSTAFNVPETVTVPGGSNEATFTVEISDQGIDPEGDTLILSIAPDAGYSVGSNYTFNVSQFCDPELRINFAFDDYASETSWELTDTDGNVVFAGGGWADGTASAVVTRCIDPGTYVFNLSDAYGDGIIDGSVTVLYAGEEVVVIPGDFGSETSVTFNTETGLIGGDTDGDTDGDEDEDEDEDEDGDEDEDDEDGDDDDDDDDNTEG